MYLLRNKKNYPRVVVRYSVILPLTGSHIFGITAKVLWRNYWIAKYIEKMYTVIDTWHVWKGCCCHADVHVFVIHFYNSLNWP